MDTSAAHPGTVSPRSRTATAASARPDSPGPTRGFLAGALRGSRSLAFTAFGMVGLLVVCVVGLLVDARMLIGEPIWMKPLKFSLSLALYSITWAWLLSLWPGGRPRWLARVADVIAVTAWIEMVLVVLQVVRGQRSHFNVATAFDSMVFSIMGATVVVLWLGSAVVAATLATRRVGSAVLTSAIRWGMLLSIIGISLGYLMVSRDSGIDGLAGSHAVGVPDGGPGMPFTGWSTAGGDLRIPHFIGIHALQLLPLLGLLICRSAGWSDRTRVRLVRLAAAGYGGVVALVTWQALRGQSLIHPDRPTVAAAGILLTALATGCWLVLRADRRGVVRPEPAPGAASGS